MLVISRTCIVEHTYEFQKDWAQSSSVAMVEGGAPSVRDAMVGLKGALKTDTLTLS